MKTKQFIYALQNQTFEDRRELHLMREEYELAAVDQKAIDLIASKKMFGYRMADGWIIWIEGDYHPEYEYAKSLLWTTADGEEILINGLEPPSNNDTPHQ
jgi:hypothetical protein